MFFNNKRVVTNKYIMKQLTASTFCTFIVLLFSKVVYSQINPNGCVIGGGFGVNSNLYTNSTFTTGNPRPPAGTVDWFLGTGGRNVINQTDPTQVQAILQGPVYNPTYIRRMNGNVISKADVISANKYKLLVDAFFARDNFGGTGATDTTAFLISSKNGQDPAAWGPGSTNVLGKNDLIDVAAHMFRDVDSSVSPARNKLIFVGLINRAEPGGSAFMDFEFFVKPVFYNPTTLKFTSGGPDMGHTSFRFGPTGKITKIGDMMFDVSLTNGGTRPGIGLRVWVKRTDWIALKANPGQLPFRFGNNFDGAGTNAAYGYADIVPFASAVTCGFVNGPTQLPTAPPWGTKNTKSNVFGTSYSAYSTSELAADMTDYGIDYLLVEGADPCDFPWKSAMIKTRTSQSFSASLKDFAGPYEWGVPSVAATSATTLLNCTNPTITLSVPSPRTDATYQWTTADGRFVGSSTGSSVVVDKAGTYFVTMTLFTGCTYKSPAYVITVDPTQPTIRSANAITTFSCFGADNGSVNLTVTGGTPPYTYAWSGPGNYNKTVEDPTGLAAGTHSVIVTDSKGCSFTNSSVVIGASPEITATNVITNVLCNGSKTGGIDITPGGAAPFTYLWNTGNTTQDLINVAAGNYSVVIKDVNKCSKTFNFSVTQPTALSSSAIKVDDTNPSAVVGNGTIDLNVTGGTAPYTYAWSGPGGFTASNQDLSNLNYGSYTVTITDANGCKSTRTVFIYEPENCADGIDNDGDGLIDCQDPDCISSTPVITGNLDPCINEDVVFSVPNNANLTYVWSVPSNATIVSGAGTNSITVKFNTTTPGKVCLVTKIAACSSNTACIVVSPKQAPLAPATINKN